MVPETFRLVAQCLSQIRYHVSETFRLVAQCLSQIRYHVPETFRLVAQCLNQLRYRVPLILFGYDFNYKKLNYKPQLKC
jgi:hypothetical protein